MSYAGQTYGGAPYGAAGGDIVVRAEVGVSVVIYEVVSAAVDIEIQVAAPVVNAEVGISVQVYEIVFAEVGVQFEIFFGLIAGFVVQITVTARTVSSKVFIEQQVYSNVVGNVGIQVEVADPVVSAVAPIEVQVYDVVSAAQVIEIEIFDYNSTSSVLWQPSVILNSVDISAKLFNDVNVTYTKSASAIASFTMRPDPGPIDVFAYVGQTVEINYIEVDSTGAVTKRIRKYSGVVDKPVYTPDQTKITFSCTNDLQGRISKMSRAEILSLVGGLWSQHVFNENGSNWEYFNDLLSTVEADVWIDYSNIMRKTDWVVGTPDHEFTDPTKIYDTVRVINPDKGDIINRVNIAMDFRYSRFIQRNVFYDSQYGQTLCHFLEQNTFILPTRKMIENAANSAGWTRMGAIAYVPLWEPTNLQATSTVNGNFSESGTVQCGGQTKGWTGDPGGEEPIFAIGASFTLSKRWTKTLTETYLMVVEAPESITANGLKSVNEDYGITAEADDADWEANYSSLEEIRDVPGNTTTIGLPLVMPSGSAELENGDWMFPASFAEGSGRDSLNEAQVVAMTKARVEILAGHRSRDIVFSVALDPFITLDHTVRLNTATVQATGRVRSIRDVMDIATGRAVTEITLASSGSGTVGIIADDLIAPTEIEPDYDLTGYDRYVWLPWHIGGRLASPPYDETWQGFTGNYEYDPDDNSRPNPFSPFDYDSVPPDVNAYPLQFTVETPDIGEGDRKSVTAETEQRIDVNIPTDELQEVA